MEAYSDADWGGDRITRRSVSAGVIMRGGHCLKVRSKKQQVVALSSAERELLAAVKTASEGLGISELGEGFGDSMQSAPGCVSNTVLGQQQGIGQGETREGATLVDTRGVQV